MSASPGPPVERRKGERRRLPDRRKARAVQPLAYFTIITGLSGAGRSETAKFLEDVGYFVVDNLPPALIGKVAELVTTTGEPRRVAIVADVRGGRFFDDLANGLKELRDREVPYRIVFLEASDDTLVRRFSTTRRRHPLAPADRIGEGIHRERLLMESLREEADLVIDSTDLTPHELRERLRETFAGPSAVADLQVRILSFAYKHGVPRDADLVLDVRFLPNPHWVDELRPLPGTAGEVRDYVTGQEAFAEFRKRLVRLLDFLVPGYVAEGKSYLTLAIGCTGGRHRSVVVAEELADYFRKRSLPVAVEHRDVDRE